MLPGKDGFAVVSTLRKAHNYVPVLILTARGRPEDVLQGFAAGADDYLPKPFQLPIFLARLQGLLRRSQWLDRRKICNKRPRGEREGDVHKCQAAPQISAPDSEVFSFDGKTIDFGTLELRVNDTTIQLTLMEAKLLRHLIRSKGRTVSRKSILEDVWGLHEDTDTRAIDNFIVRLRRYIEKDPSKPKASPDRPRRRLPLPRVAARESDRSRTLFPQHALSPFDVNQILPSTEFA